MTPGYSREALAIPSNPFHEMLFSGESPEPPALIGGDIQLSWSELRHLVLGAIAVLQSSGLAASPAGDGIAVCPSNTIEAVVLLLACLVADVPVLLIHEKLTLSEQSAIRIRAGVTESLPHLLSPTWRWSCAALHRSYPDLAVVVFTSGSSGIPKGVALGRHQLLAAAEASEKRLGWHTNDRWLLSMSLAHVGGLSVLTRCLLARKTVVLSAIPRFSAAELMSLCVAHRVTLLSVVPTMLKRLLESTPGELPESIRAILVGGGMSSPSLLLSGWRRRWPILPTYGMTECCSQIATLHPQTLAELWSKAKEDESPSSHIRLPGCGPVLEGYQLRVREGMLEVKSPALCYGYLPSNGELSGLEASVEADGFFRTGDLGWVDEWGCVHVEGRRSDRIVTGGENVSPLEVELVLEACDGVVGACVFGEDDSEFGQKVVAVMVTEAGRWDEDLLRALVRTLRQKLATFKVPRVFLPVDALVLNSVGKLDRLKTIAKARENAAAASFRIDSSSDLERR